MPKYIITIYTDDGTVEVYAFNEASARYAANLLTTCGEVSEITINLQGKPGELTKVFHFKR